jgi:hypothetical protein
MQFLEDKKRRLNEPCVHSKFIESKTQPVAMTTEGLLITKAEINKAIK